MPYVFQTFDKAGKPHPRWKFQYTDWQGQRKSSTGSTSKRETEKLAELVEGEERAIRKGWKKPPKGFDTPRPFSEVRDAYLSWGNSQGGRGGRPWGNEHARQRGARLEWWEKELRPNIIGDLLSSLPRVEKALQRLQKKGVNREKGLSGKTLQNYAEALKALCLWCVERGYLESNPLAGLANFNTMPESERRALTATEIGQLLRSCDPRRRLVYEVALASGLRAGELRALCVKHLKPKLGGLILDAAWTKSRKPGLQPLPAALIEKLTEAAAGMRQDDALLYVPACPARDFYVDLDKAGIARNIPGQGKVDFHALRITHTTLVVESGATVKEAQALARHSNPNLTMNTYARVRNERLSEITELVGDALNPEPDNTTGTQRKAAGAENIDTDSGYVVPKGGLEPPQPCGH